MRTMHIGELVDPDLVARSDSSELDVQILAPGEASGPTDSLHPTSERWVIVFAGNGQAEVGAQTILLREGSLLLIEAGEPYRLLNTGDRPLETVSVVAPVRGGVGN